MTTVLAWATLISLTAASASDAINCKSSSLGARLDTTAPLLSFGWATGLRARSMLHAVQAANAVFVIAIDNLNNALFPINLALKPELEATSRSSRNRNNSAAGQFRSSLFASYSDNGTSFGDASSGLAQRVETSSQLFDSAIEHSCLKSLEYLHGARYSIKL